MSGRMDRSSEHHQRNFYSRHHLHKDLGTGSDSIIFLSSSTEPLQTSNWTRHNNNWQWWRFIKSGHQLRIARHHCWAVFLRFFSRGLLCPPFNSFKFLWTWLSCGGLDNGTKFLEPIRLRISCIRASSPEKTIGSSATATADEGIPPISLAGLCYVWWVSNSKQPLGFVWLLNIGLLNIT